MARLFEKPSRRIFISPLPRRHSCGRLGVRLCSEAPLAAGNNVQIYHNSCLQQDDIVAGSVPTRNFVFRDNVTNFGTYGMNCMSPGGLSKCWPQMKMTNKLIINTPRDSQASNYYYPPNNYFPTFAGAGFTDPVNGNYRLAVSSPHKGKASDGTDPGVDMDALNNALKIAR